MIWLHTQWYLTASGARLDVMAQKLNEKNETKKKCKSKPKIIKRIGGNTCKMLKYSICPHSQKEG